MCTLCPAGSYSEGGNATAARPECVPCPANATSFAAGGAGAGACTGAPPRHLVQHSACACAGGFHKTLAFHAGVVCAPRVLGAVVPAHPASSTWGQQAAKPKQHARPLPHNPCSHHTDHLLSRLIAPRSPLIAPRSPLAACRPGYGAASATAECSLCPAGTFSIGGTRTVSRPPCSSCRPNLWTLAVGANSSARCTGGCRVCAPITARAPNIARVLGWSVAHAPNTCVGLRDLHMRGNACGHGAARCAHHALRCRRDQQVRAGHQHGWRAMQPTNSPTITLAACAAGYGSLACSICPVGTYSAAPTAANPKPNCLPCSSNVTTIAAGARDVGMCTGAQARGRERVTTLPPGATL